MSTRQSMLVEFFNWTSEIKADTKASRKQNQDYQISYYEAKVRATWNLASDPPYSYPLQLFWLFSKEQHLHKQLLSEPPTVTDYYLATNLEFPGPAWLVSSRCYIKMVRSFCCSEPQLYSQCVLLSSSLLCWAETSCSIMSSLFLASGNLKICLLCLLIPGGQVKTIMSYNCFIIRKVSQLHF